MKLIRCNFCQEVSREDEDRSNTVEITLPNNTRLNIHLDVRNGNHQIDVCSNCHSSIIDGILDHIEDPDKIW